MMKSAYLGCIVVLVTFLQSIAVAQPKEDPNPERFEEVITTFQQWDLKNSFPDDAVLFVGSSSIRFWETSKAFPTLPVINRGFGGSHISDVQHYYEQTIGKYNPSVIVFYAGDNDIAADKSIPQVIEGYKALTDKILADFPEAEFVYISIKPSASRWRYWQKMDEANQQIKEYNKQNERLFYVDLATPLLGEDGRPNGEYFIADQLHLSEAGYRVWNKIMSKELERVLSGYEQNE